MKVGTLLHSCRTDSDLQLDLMSLLDSGSTSRVSWPSNFSSEPCVSPPLTCTLRCEDWQGIFRAFDRDRSGSIEGAELSAALTQFGYTLSPQLVQTLERKYSESCVPLIGMSHSRLFSVAQDPPLAKAGALGAGPRAGITFDAFVRCCVTTRQISESFKRADHDHDGWVNLSCG